MAGEVDEVNDASSMPFTCGTALWALSVRVVEDRGDYNHLFSMIPKAAEILNIFEIQQDFSGWGILFFGTMSRVFFHT